MDEAVNVMQSIVAAVESHGYSEGAVFAVRLALDEALSNAIRHGNQNNPKKTVTVEYEVTDDQARISICDEGPGFTPADLPDPTLDENLERPHGRGVMLIQAYMTEVSYNDKGNCVTMVKHRTCQLPE
jgi:serine/threonine-protein kinase RsbW